MKALPREQAESRLLDLTAILVGALFGKFRHKGKRTVVQKTNDRVFIKSEITMSRVFLRAD
jgi:hypothetical protein